MRSRPFKELFAVPLRNGLTKPKAIRGAGVKMVNMGELFAFSRIENVSMDRVPLEPMERETSLLQAGDLLFARQSLVLSGAGKCSIFISDDEDVCFESHVIRCRLSRELADPNFYYYFFQSPKGRSLVQSIVEQGAGASGIRGSDLAGIEVPWVDLVDQVEIARVLVSLDELIAVNDATCNSLESIAQIIFKSWFVDFNPVKAKIAAIQEGRDPLRAAMSAISGKADDALDFLPDEQRLLLASYAQIFPDSIIRSEIGNIPKGWNAQSIRDLARFKAGKTTVSKLSVDDYVSTENMIENRGGIHSASSIPSSDTVPSFSAGNVLLSNIRPYFKKIWLATFDGGRSPDVLAFEAINPQQIEYMYHLLSQDEFFEFMTRTAKGAKMPRGDKDAIMGWKFPAPDNELREAFSSIVRPFHARTESLRRKIESLKSLRDALLPKLLSGEIAVKDSTDQVVTAKDM